MVEQINGSKRLILGKYEQGKHGVLVVETKEGRFSPLDIRNSNLVITTIGHIRRVKEIREFTPLLERR